MDTFGAVAFGYGLDRIEGSTLKTFFGSSLYKFWGICWGFSFGLRLVVVGYSCLDSVWYLLATPVWTLRTPFGSCWLLLFGLRLVLVDLSLIHI